MAYYYNYKFWLATADDIKNLLLKKDALKQIKPTQDKHVAHNIFSMIYGRYVALVNRLSYLFDVTLQVQKRELIRRLLEAATNRLIEVRNELKEIELSEYIYLDDTLIKLKVVLDDVQLLRPFHFPMTRDPEVQDVVDNKFTSSPTDEATHEGMMSAAAKSVPKRKLDKSGKKSNILLELAQTNPEKYNMIVASNLIRVHEKARQARVFLTNIHYQPEIYQPQAPDIGKGVHYEYTHKPDHPMLTLVRRTFYDSNYFVERQIMGKVEYYVRPTHRSLKLRDMQSKTSRTSDDGSIDDDFINFFEEMTMYEYEKSHIGTGISEWGSGSRSAIVNVKDKVESMANLGDPTQMAHGVQFEGMLIEGELGPGDIPRTPRDGTYEQPPSAHADVKPVVGEETQNAAGVDEHGPEKTTAIMEKRKTEFPESRKPSGISISRARHGPKSRDSSNSVDGSNDGKITESLQSLLTKKLKESAATKIQMRWRRYLLQKRLERRKLRKLILYGMVSEWKWDKKLNKDLDKERLKFRARKTIFDKNFIEVCENEKARILKVRGPWIMEDITEHIRAWFREFYDGAADFDRYPEEFEGGTILVIRGETMTIEEFLKAKEEQKKKKSPEEKKKEQEARKAEREKKKEQKRREKQLAKLQKLLEAKEGKTYDFAKESRFLTEIIDVMNEYSTEWANIDEKNNVDEDPYMDWITSDKYAEVHQELRVTVDEFMRIEFELLRKALAEDQKKKYKPQKKKKEKKKGKKGKKGKRQPKDITGDRSTQSLYLELKDYGIIKDIPPTNLDDYIAEYNYSAYEKRIIYQMDPPPGQGEIKDVIREALIGMGPLTLPKVKSLLLTGPLRSGKKFLLNAIASEIGAVVLDISPAKVVQFDGNMKYFLHLINKMARILQPTILFIDDCERIFSKKVPPEEAHLNPRLIGKYIIKQIVKPIKKEEKVMLLGISSEPFKAKLGNMKKCFEKVIVVPRVDYGTTFQLHRALSLQKYGVPRDFEFSPVSTVAKGYASSIIYDNLNDTLGVERRMKFSRQPLKAQEIVEGFFSGAEPQFPVSDEEFAKFTKFYTSVNKLAKQREKFMKEQARLKEKQKGKK